LGIKDFLEIILNSLELFQEKHRVISQTFSKTYNADDVDDFLVKTQAELTEGKRILQDRDFTLCLIEFSRNRTIAQ
jgi:arsenite-transporting ATPase